MEIDTDLIENLRKTLDEYQGGVIGVSALVTVASEIVESVKSTPDVEAYEDRGGEVWVKGASGFWDLEGSVDDGQGRTLMYIDRSYGPLKPVRR